MYSLKTSIFLRIKYIFDQIIITSFSFYILLFVKHMILTTLLFSAELDYAFDRNHRIRWTRQALREANSWRLENPPAERVRFMWNCEHWWTWGIRRSQKGIHFRANRRLHWSKFITHLFTTQPVQLFFASSTWEFEIKVLFRALLQVRKDSMSITSV